MEDQEPEGSYATEARERWGDTDAYKQSRERLRKMSKEDMERIGKEAEAITQAIADHADLSPTDPAIQALIARHHNHLRHFYEPSLELYRGLGEMYVTDPRFTAHYEKYRPGLAAFMRDSIAAYCDKNEKAAH